MVKICNKMMHIEMVKVFRYTDSEHNQIYHVSDGQMFIIGY